MTGERGSISLYLLFTIAASVAAGIGAYVWIRDHKPSQAEAADEVPHVVAAPKHDLAQPQPAPEAPEAAEPAPPQPPAEVSVAEQRAVDPIMDPNSDISPVFGVPGIDGGIERSSVDRRFRTRGALLQRCFERSGADAGRVHVTLSVAANGHIDQVKLGDDMNEGFQTCVVTLLSAMSFSSTHDGHAATVVQPIAFKTTN